MNWIQTARERAKNLINYVDDLEAKNAHLRKELELISAGFYLTEHKDLSQDHGTRLQLRAARALAKEGNLQNRVAWKHVL
jgi:hypothetical protein